MAESAKQHEHSCPECQKEEEPIGPILLLSLGGMLAFFAFAFWIVTFAAEPGFLPLALGMTIVGAAMMCYGWHLIAKRKQVRAAKHQDAMAKAKCEYCGGQNQPGDTKCQFCGAPLF